MTQDELTTAIKAAHDAGYHGVAIWAQAGQYVAAALNKDGMICEPRNWEAQTTPAAALIDLAAKLVRMPAK